MADIWAKIGGAVKKGVETTKDALLLVPKALIYPIKKPFASLDEMKHDAKVSLKEAVGMNVPEKEREYDPPIETTQASKNLGIEIISYKGGKIKFLASRMLVGDVSHLSPKQLGQIEALPNVDVFREENKVVIEVDVEKITNDVKNNSEHKGKSLEEIKGLVLKRIYDEVNRNLKDLAGITGGELKVHTDRKLLHGIAGKLYREHNEQLSKTAISDKSSNTMKPSEAVNKITTQNNMTNPLKMYYLQSEVITEKTGKVKGQQADYEAALRGQNVQLNAFNLENVSSETAVSSSPIPNTGNNKRDSGGRSLS